MKIKSNQDLAESRLILLYLAAKMPVGLEHDDIVRIVHEGNLMLYFVMEQCLLELVENDLMAVLDADEKRIYSVTAEGLNVLSLLKTRINLPIRTFIDERIASRRAEMELELEITANYSQDSAFEFPIRLKIAENLQTLLELNLTAASAEDAAMVCRRFREEAADIYTSLIARLTRDEQQKGANQTHGNL